MEKLPQQLLRPVVSCKSLEVTTIPFDNFNKRLFQELLSLFGQVLPNMAVIGDGRMIAIFFAPYYELISDEQELGNLTQIMKEPALLEPYRSALYRPHHHRLRHTSP